MRPRMPRKLRSDVQPDAHQRNQHNIYKIAAQNVIRDGKRKERIRSSGPNSALDRRHGLRKAVHRAQRPHVRRGGRTDVHIHRAW